MTGKSAELIQIPNQRLFRMREAARYLGLHPDTVRELVDLGRLSARRMGDRRVFRLEDLDQFIDSLPEWLSEKRQGNAGAPWLWSKAEGSGKRGGEYWDVGAGHPPRNPSAMGNLMTSLRLIQALVRKWL